MEGGRRGEEAYCSPGLPALSEAAERDPDKAGGWGNLSGSLVPPPLRAHLVPVTPALSRPAGRTLAGWLGPGCHSEAHGEAKASVGKSSQAGRGCCCPQLPRLHVWGLGGECLVFAAHVNKTGGYCPPAPAVGLHVARNQGGHFLSWGAGEKLGTAGVRPETLPRRELCQLSDRRKAFYPIWHQTE